MNGLTQNDLATIVNISKANISKYERGELYPTKDISIKLSRLFNLKSKYFYDDYLSAMDTFHQDLITLLNNINISKNKFCNICEISKKTLYRYLYHNDLPSRIVFLKLKGYLENDTF